MIEAKRRRHSAFPLDKPSGRRHESAPFMSHPHNYLSWRIWTVYAVLAGISIPWYWPAEDQRMLLGFPLWVVVSVMGSLAVSGFTAWLFVCRWPDDEEEGEA